MDDILQILSIILFTITKGILHRLTHTKIYFTKIYIKKEGFKTIEIKQEYNLLKLIYIFYSPL